MPSAGLQPLIISAPFGNYIQPQGATPTLGTFTAEARPGRLWRILKTVRYYRRLGGWVNRIGLRNPGMPALVKQVRSGKIQLADKIVSIHGFAEADWWQLLEAVAGIGPRAVELNMSCPNVGEIDWPVDLFRRAASTGVPVIVKLPPVNYQVLFEQAREAGLATFHCCNTLPVPAGGISGQPLKPVALQCIRDLLRRDGEIKIIGGGGIRTPQDVDDYVESGARHVAVGTKVFNPLYLVTSRPLQPLIDRAAEKLGPGPSQD